MTRHQLTGEIDTICTKYRMSMRSVPRNRCHPVYRRTPNNLARVVLHPER